MIRRFHALLYLLVTPTAALAAADADPATATSPATQPAAAVSPATQPAATVSPATQPAATASPADKGWGDLFLHAGLNLRTDPGVHQLRLDAGARWGAVDAVLVLDPMFFTDGQVSSDLLLQWRWDLGLAAIVGWRLTTIPLLKGPQMQQSLLLGVGTDLPSFFDGLVRGQVGFELASTVVKHGGGLPVETISFESGRHYVDLVNAALFVRLEAGWGS